MKIIGIILIVVALVGVAVIGGVYYVVHRVKQAVVHTANTYGVDLNSIPSPVAHGSASRVKVRAVCDWLSTDEVSHLIGQPVERKAPVEQTCGYYGPAGLSTKMEQDLRNRGTAQLEPGKANEKDITGMLEQMENTTAGVQLEPGQEMPLVMIAVDPDGRAQYTAMALTKGIFSGISKASEAKGGISVGSDVPGLGDKAIRLPKMGLNVLQGDTLIRVIPGPFPGSNAKTIDLARAVLAKL